MTTVEDGLIESWAKWELKPGVAAGAAAYQLCRLLGANGTAPTLQRMLEEMLADANRNSADRAQILADFDVADAEAARDARLASFARLNPNAGELRQ